MVGTSSATMSAMQRAISPASPPSSASLDNAAPAVSMTVTKRQVQFRRQPHSPAGFPQSARAERRARGLPSPVLPEQHARHVTEPDEGEDQARIDLALTGSVERKNIRGGVEQQLPHPRPVRAARGDHRIPGGDVRQTLVPGGSASDGRPPRPEVMMRSARSTISAS